MAIAAFPARHRRRAVVRHRYSRLASRGHGVPGDGVHRHRLPTGPPL